MNSGDEGGGQGTVSGERSSAEGGPGPSAGHGENPAEDVLRYLADPENWLGDPFDQTSTLHGHFTPYELARDWLETHGRVAKVSEHLIDPRQPSPR